MICWWWDSVVVSIAVLLAMPWFTCQIGLLWNGLLNLLQVLGRQPKIGLLFIRLSAVTHYSALRISCLFREFLNPFQWPRTFFSSISGVKMYWRAIRLSYPHNYCGCQHSNHFFCPVGWFWLFYGLKAHIWEIWSEALKIHRVVIAPFSSNLNHHHSNISLAFPVPYFLCDYPQNDRHLHYGVTSRSNQACFWYQNPVIKIQSFVTCCPHWHERVDCDLWVGSCFRLAVCAKPCVVV